jgi:hypothetical protein
MISSSFFYLINNKYVDCHKVNDALANGDERYDVSTERQFRVLNIINDYSVGWNFNNNHVTLGERGLFL